ncbi:Ribonuclease H2 subunit A [Geranomyces michiganensis]|nr:Ribonuclease H2 subunit A [Geranomyces michiganensis]
MPQTRSASLRFAATRSPSPPPAPVDSQPSQNISLSPSPSPASAPPPDTDPLPESYFHPSHVPTTACTVSWTHHTPVPAALANGEKACLGVDEAGRGPVLGPMVYACAYMPLDKKEELAALGLDDSKVLKEEQRDDLFAVMEGHGDWIGWGVHACSPQDISACMLRRAKHSLNALAHDTTIELIRETIARGVNVAEVYVDTVGPPAPYAAKLQTFFPGIRITVAKKADSLYPCVSAASIVAKVSRDAALKGWKWVEAVEGVFTKRFGSGYPSDPNTVKWLNEHVDPVFGYPRLMRFSWSTCVKILEDKAVGVIWPADEEDDEGADIRGYFTQKDQPMAPAPRDVLLDSFQHVSRV